MNVIAGPRELRDALAEMAKLAHRAHYTCEDCFYSCPAAKDEDGEWDSCNDDSGEHKCNCGADQHNAKVDGLLLSVLR